MTLPDPNDLMMACIEYFENEESNQKTELTHREMLWATMMMMRQSAHLTYGEIANLMGANSADAIEKFLKRNEHSRRKFFNELESKLSVVGT